MGGVDVGVDDNGHVERRIFFNRFHEFVSIHLGHHDVEQNDVGLKFDGFGNPFEPIKSPFYVKSFGFEGELVELYEIFGVVDDEDFWGGHGNQLTISSKQLTILEVERRY